MSLKTHTKYQRSNSPRFGGKQSLVNFAGSVNGRFIMLRKLFGTLIVATLILGGIRYFQKPRAPKADFTYVIGDEIKTLDPAKLLWNEDIRIGLGIWEGLASYDPKTTEPIDGVANIPPHISADGRTYIFELRPEARWSNGDPVTAHDFVFAWRRVIEPGTAGDYTYLFTDIISGVRTYSQWRNRAVRFLTLIRDLKNDRPLDAQDLAFMAEEGPVDSSTSLSELEEIAESYRQKHMSLMDQEFAKTGIVALDNRHLKVELIRPTAYFLDLTAFATFLPVHRPSMERLIIRDSEFALWSVDPQWVKPDYYKNGYPGLVSNGAFSLKAWEFKRYMYFEKNPHYWDAENVKSRSILGRVFNVASTAFLAYEEGGIDIYRSITRLEFAPALYEQSKKGTRNDIHVRSAFGTYFYIFNCQDKLPNGTDNPCADPRVRRAFNLAVNKQKIADKVKKTGNGAAYNLVPLDSIAGYYCPPGPGYNIERAQQLLRQAGYPDGQGLPTIEILYNTGFGHEYVAQAVAEMWRKSLNVNVIANGKEIKTFDDDKKNQRFMICRASWFGDFSDPMTFLDMMMTGNGNNNGRFSHKPYDILLAEATDCTDPTERFALLADAESLLMREQLPILPIYYYVNLTALQPEVRGFYPNAREINPWKYIYLEK